ncbi:MAG TPA: radical SAM protein [Candidatus Ozemobacteraceae bacterium]|nr:radical SAM protein [Candidatus Ozemobacteraceae bacterium]
MSVILVSAAAISWAKAVNREGRKSYLDAFLKDVGGIQNARFFPIEHLGTASIKAYCTAQGIPTETVNAVASYHTCWEETFDAIRRVALRLGAPTILGFSGSNVVLEENLWLANACKQLWPDVSIIFGQDFATINAERLLRDYPIVDYVGRGFGELLVAELFRIRTSKVSALETISGLAWRDQGGKIRQNPFSPVSLKSLPWVARDDVHIANYHGYGVAVSTARGCPYACTYCASGGVHRVLGRAAYQTREIDDVLEEVAWLYKDHAVRHLVITDEVFFTTSEESKERARAFACGLRDRGLEVQFMIDARVDALDPTVLKPLYDAGLRQMFIGIETGDEAQRARYGKAYPPGTDVKKNLQGVLDLGIRIIPGVLTFHPETTMSELDQTFSLISDLGIARVFSFLNRVNPIPGTHLHEEFRHKGYLRREWPIAEFVFRDASIQALHDEFWSLSAQPEVRTEDFLQVFRRHLNKHT